MYGYAYFCKEKYEGGQVTLPIGNLYRYYIMGEKLFLDFGAKFQRLFYLSPFNYTYLSEFVIFGLSAVPVLKMIRKVCTFY